MVTAPCLHGPVCLRKFVTSLLSSLATCPTHHIFGPRPAMRISPGCEVFIATRLIIVSISF